MALFSAALLAFAGAAASAGVAAASAPNYPNPAKSSRKAVLADLNTLPGRRMVDQAARLGTEIDYPTGKTQWLRPKAAFARGLIDKATYTRLRQAEKDSSSGAFDLPTDMGSTLRFFGITGEGLPGGLSPGLKAEDLIRSSNGRVLINTGPLMAHADFRGVGDADVQAKSARAMARSALDLSHKYGDQFIQSAKEQQALADPEGTQARGLLASEINRMETERATAQRPVADRLDQMIGQELKLGRTRTPDVDAAVARVLAERNASGSGGTIGAGDIATELTTGPRGDAEHAMRLQKAMGYLSSGATPEDVDYRRRQQGLANMASFLAGRTPQAQFNTLSGGQQGATPMARGPGLVDLNPNAQQLATTAGINTLNAATTGANANTNGWFAGLSALTRGINAYQSARGGR